MKSMSKGKVVRVVLIAILVCSTLVFVTPTLLSWSSSKHLTSTVSASGIPSVSFVSETYTDDSGSTNVTGWFQNDESIAVSGTMTATLETYPNHILTQTSSTIVLPPVSTSAITVTFVGTPYQNGYAITVKFNANSVSSPTNSGSQTGTQNSNPGVGATAASTKNGFNAGALVIPLVIVGAVVVGSMGGLFMFRRTRVSEEKIKRYTSYDYQNWVMQRLRAHPSSVLESRRGIDGFTGDNIPLSIKQSDNVGRLQVDSFMNGLIQAKTRQGAMVAFGYDAEARAAVTRARANRMDIKLFTVKELIDNKNPSVA
jgi:hypothetical protein